MPLFGLTVLARDATGEHYTNHTVRAASLDRADALVSAHYEAGAETLIEFDQAVALDGDDCPNGPEMIIETLAKIYFDEKAPLHA